MFILCLEVKYDLNMPMAKYQRPVWEYPSSPGWSPWAPWSAGTPPSSLDPLQPP